MLPGPYLVGGLACLLSSRCQRLGDLAANTIVIRIPRVAEPNLDQFMSDTLQRGDSKQTGAA